MGGGSNNGVLTSCCGATSGGRAIHDGFATIRAGGGKRGRSYSSPTVAQDNSTTAPCSHGCCGPGGGRGWTMEPLWEEKGEGGTPAVSRRDRPQLPWWEVATRRSRYRSCPAFSQVSMLALSARVIVYLLISHFIGSGLYILTRCMFFLA